MAKTNLNEKDNEVKRFKKLYETIQLEKTNTQ